MIPFKSYEIIYFAELLLAAFFISVISNILVIRYSRISGRLLDKDTELKPQKMHSGNVPRAGGVGILFSFIFIVIFGLKYGYLLLAIPVLLIFFSGFFEDFNHSFSPKHRLVLQTIGTLLGIYLFDAVILDVGFTIPYYVGIVFSVFCIVGITNSINIIDGFNGLAGGFCLLALLSIGCVAYFVGNVHVLYICFGLIGAVVGFLVLNFPKGFIFLGDCGAYTLGFIIALLLILLTQSENSSISAWYGFCIMIYPICEVIFSIYRKKILRSISAMQPDGVHFHMLIYKRVTRSNYLTSVLILGMNIPFVFLPILFFDNEIILLLISITFVVIYLCIYYRIIKFKGLKY